MSFIGDLFGGDDASDAAVDAANIAADADREALEYLKEREALPIQYRDQALDGLGAAYLPTTTSSNVVGGGASYGYFNPNQYVTNGQTGFQFSGLGLNIPGFNAPATTTTTSDISPDWIYDRAVNSGLYQGLLPASQEELLAEAENSALYQAIMSGRDQGEQAILRNASATGGLRSGNSIEDLANFNTNLQNQALLSGYNEAVRREQLNRDALLTSFGDVRSGVGSLATLGGNESEIANLYSSIGRNQAAGITGAAQAEQDALGLGLNTALGVAGLFFSDIRLKKNIQPLEVVNGHQWYTWEWNEVAEKFGLSGNADGVLAHEVYEYLPEAIGTLDGYMVVDYSRLIEEDRKRIH